MSMHKKILFLHLLLIVLVSFSACSGPTVYPPPEDVLYLNLMWHQHQPLYYKDENGIYTRPWVRVHATKDYYDMAATVACYPDVHVTFNLTPVLLRQLDDFAHNGAKDKNWILAEKPASQLTLDEKEFILRRFFDANWEHVIERYPGYRTLLEKRGGADDSDIARSLQTFSEQDFRDLQIWFNLAWIDPDELEKEPLKLLVAKDHDFSEEDKAVLFDEITRIVRQVIPLHKELQDRGQIEVITTPYAHPILPLIYDTNLALVGNPDAEMPERFSYPNDAIAQLKRSAEIYRQHFDRQPRGLWPGEGAVAQEIVPLVAKTGYQWMASGEPVLAQSLGIGGFTRDIQETVQEADALYRPYYVVGKNGEKVAIFFRDWTLSDKIGFTYSGTPGDKAAADLMRRLENIRLRLKEENASGPHVVSIILDGENAWEYYDNDGKLFLNTLYRLLSESKTIKTITPSEYLTLFPENRTLERLFPGAWFSANYDTWIGESEERQAWNYLVQTRYALSKYDMSKTRSTSPEAIARAQDYMYLAEGSDWFWWYGSDQDSGQDEYFDQGFRALLAKVYESLGEPVPAFVNVPIIPKKPAKAEQEVKGFSTPTIDGLTGAEEWLNAARFAGGAQSAGADLSYTFDSQNLYVRLGNSRSLPPGATIGIYLAAPRPANVMPFAHNSSDTHPLLLGMAATHLLEWEDTQELQVYQAGKTGWESKSASVQAAKGADTFEVAIAWDALGELEAGDDLRMVAVIQPAGILLPLQGPAQIIVPDRGTSITLLAVDDPPGDDNGPGSYIYPTDAVFQAGVFDLKSFTVAYDDKNLIIFKFAFYGPVPNPWGSPNNLALQTLDVYVDKDPGAGTGARLLLPGRNAALSAGNGWEYAVWAEGWTPQFIAPDAQSGAPQQVTGVSFKVIVDPAAQTVTLRVPRFVFGEGDPATWGFAAAVLSQEGYPSTGVWRVRDVNFSAEQWRFGGAPQDANHTRIIDLAWDSTPAQNEILSTYPPRVDIASLTADDFAQIPLLLVK